MGTAWKNPQSKNLKERLNYVQTTQRGYDVPQKYKNKDPNEEIMITESMITENTVTESNRDIELLQKTQIEMMLGKTKQINKPN